MLKQGSLSELKLQRKPSSTRLQVNEPGDRFEQEADTMAEKVVNGQSMPGYLQSSVSGSLQRSCAHCKEEDRRKGIMRKENGSASNGAVSANFLAQLSARNGTGMPLPSDTRHFMEQRFGSSFSQVRIHADEQAENLSNEINAKAFTIGTDVYFNKGAFNTGSTEGKKLLAHELTHVVQQENKAAGIQRQVAPAVPAAPRQDVVFIMGADRPRSGNQFFTAALRFFRARVPNANFVTDLRTLEDVLSHIRANFTSPLGNVFIVTHANEDGTVAFGLDSNDTDTSLSVVELRNALHPSGGGSSTLTNVSRQIDAQTTIQIKGCDLGRNQAVVELFDEAFGGAATVTAPTHEQTYSFNTGEIRTATDAAMSSHMTTFEATLPAIPPVPAAVPRGLRGAELREARRIRTEALEARAEAQREHRRLMDAERARFRPEAALTGELAGTHDALSGPMFQRPGDQLFTAAEIEPQVNSLYPHLSDAQRAVLTRDLVAPDRRRSAAAHSQGTFQQSGQRAYQYRTRFTYTAPTTLSQVAIAFAGMFRRERFTPTGLTLLPPTVAGTTTTFNYSIDGTVPVGRRQTEPRRFTASSAPIESDASIIQQVRTQVNNPEKYNWRVEQATSAAGILTKTVIRERVVAYLHHRSLNASANNYFDPAETDRRFYAASTFAPPTP